MSRLVLALVLVAVAVAVALVLRRRQPDPPTQRAWTVPQQLDRRDFDRPEVAWLVAVFSSATCEACAGVLERARALDGEAVVAQDVPHQQRRDLHERYRIDAVPTLVVADADGVVRASFVGPVTSTDLWATVAELREPGTLPEGACDHGGGSEGSSSDQRSEDELEGGPPGD